MSRERLLRGAISGARRQQEYSVLLSNGIHSFERFPCDVDTLKMIINYSIYSSFAPAACVRGPFLTFGLAARVLP